MPNRLHVPCPAHLAKHRLHTPHQAPCLNPQNSPQLRQGGCYCRPRAATTASGCRGVWGSSRGSDGPATAIRAASQDALGGQTPAARGSREVGGRAELRVLG